MSPTETAALLRQLNEWRRGGDIDPPGPLAVGEAIDAAVEMIERLEAAESEAIEQARLNGMGSEREAALLAKLEAAEKERANANAAAAGIALKTQKLEDDRAIDTQRMAILVAKMNEAERERDALRAENASLVDDMNLLRDNNTSLRAKIAEMEQQEPAGEVVHNGESAGLYDILEQGALLYALPGAQTQGEEK